MKHNILTFVLCLTALLSLAVSCSKPTTDINKKGGESVSNITNEKMKNYPFLQDMYEDGYFPNFLVDKGKAILIRLCESIEAQKPTNLAELYKLTHSATEEFNDLAEEFEENDSEIETVARECIGIDIENISRNYGFEADIEELIAPRDW